MIARYIALSGAFGIMILGIFSGLQWDVYVYHSTAQPLAPFLGWFFCYIVPCFGLACALYGATCNPDSDDSDIGILWTAYQLAMSAGITIYAGIHFVSSNWLFALWFLFPAFIMPVVWFMILRVGCLEEPAPQRPVFRPGR